MSQYNYQAFVYRYTNAVKLNAYNAKRLFIIKRACVLLGRYSEYDQYQCIQKWSTEFKVSSRALRLYMNGEDSDELTQTEKLREFLSTFIIKENEISGQVDIERDEIKYTRDELEIIAEDEGIRTSNLGKLLKTSNKNITVVDLFNPLNIMLQNLADNYRGEPLIHQLAACVKAYDFGDNEPDFYQKRLEYYLHKWLCKAAGQALHISNNDVMLLWIEPLGGSGKSFLNQWLFSLPDFQQYYIRISENESFMDMKGISSAKFAIDWDELPLSRKRYLSFKSHIAATGGQRYNKVTKAYEPYTRQVNFLGSTNKANRDHQNGYLFDEDTAMMRRIAPIEIEGKVNYQKYLKEIELQQLWGQAASDILNAKETNNNRLLTWECDHEDLRTQNRRYIAINHKDQENNIKKMIVPGCPGEGELASSVKVIQILKSRGVKIFMNEYQVGKFMAQNGFISGRTKNNRGWWIKV